MVCLSDLVAAPVWDCVLDDSCDSLLDEGCSDEWLLDVSLVLDAWLEVCEGDEDWVELASLEVIEDSLCDEFSLDDDEEGSDDDSRLLGRDSDLVRRLDDWLEDKIEEDDCDEDGCDEDDEDDEDDCDEDSKDDEDEDDKDDDEDDEDDVDEDCKDDSEGGRVLELSSTELLRWPVLDVSSTLVPDPPSLDAETRLVPGMLLPLSDALTVLLFPVSASNPTVSPSRRNTDRTLANTISWYDILAIPLNVLSLAWKNFLVRLIL